MRSWFTSEKCSGFEIQKRVSISDAKVVAQKVVLEESVSVNLMRRIAKLPPEGEKMISFADNAAETVVLFHCGKNKEQINFINGKIQTPATSFYAGKQVEAEKIFQDITLLLHAEYGKSVLVVKGLPQEFPDFKITFTGEEKFDGAPTTVSGSKRLFLVKDSTGREQTLSVSSGQTPPQPLKFKVQNQEYTLVTYRSSQGEDLFPERFIIEK